MSLPDTLELLGTTIADKYAFEAVVGEGGFAVVYRATHLLWKRPVAVKVFKALGDFGPEHRAKLLEEFIREGALLADLSERSAAIVQARDVGMLTTKKGDEVPYMVLEWLEGATLESILLKEKTERLPLRTVDETIRLLEPAAEALALAHTKGIAHRDVKPPNIFVLGDPRAPTVAVKILDFGIAKVVQDAQKMGGGFARTSGQITSFTPAYGAPEQFSRSHGATGPWTDVFSLALVCVEVLTGRDPLDGDDFMQLAFASSNPAARPTPRARGAVVTDAVEQVFLRALAVKPDQRYANGGDFWNALRVASSMAPLRKITANPASANSQALAATIMADSSGSNPTVLADSASIPVVPSRRADLPAIAPGHSSSPSGAKAKWGVLAAVGASLVVVAGLWAAQSKHSAAPPMTPVPSAQASSSAAPAARAASAASPPSASPCPAGMLPIPGGEYFMGSDDDLDLEKPAHHVMLSPYCIGATEVTVAEYKACSDRGACKRAGMVNEWKGITDHEKKVFDPLCNGRDPKGRAAHPINCVDWEQASEYCDALAPGARLPTEAEWEFAARGPDGRKYPWGDELPSAARLNACGLECLAWGKANDVPEVAMYQADDGFPNTAPVGSFPQGRSRYGVADVAGNVWEWVADWFAPYANAKNPNDRPADPKGPPSGTERVVRGGSWNGADAAWVRPTFRYHDPPDQRAYGVGFRCASAARPPGQ